MPMLRSPRHGAPSIAALGMRTTLAPDSDDALGCRPRSREGTTCRASNPRQGQSDHPVPRRNGWRDLGNSELRGRCPLYSRPCAVTEKLSLELGGKSACFVFEDADVVSVAGRLAAAATIISGQQCTAARRVLVHRSRLHEIREALGSALSVLRVGPGISWVMVPARPFFIGKPGCVRSSAWIWLFSSTDRTMACPIGA